MAVFVEAKRHFSGCISGGAGVDAAHGLWQAASELLTDAEQDVDMPAALAPTVTHDISACDAQFMALARMFNVRLVTGDRQLLRHFPVVATPLPRNPRS